MAAVLSCAKRGPGNAVRHAEGGAEEGVASDRIWGIARLLVWAHHPDGLLGHLQEPPVLGIPRQTCHGGQVHFPCQTLLWRSLRFWSLCSVAQPERSWSSLRTVVVFAAISFYSTFCRLKVSQLPICCLPVFPCLVQVASISLIVLGIISQDHPNS